MALHRDIDGSEPIRAEGLETVEQRRARSTQLATGTLACPDCDAPVLPDRPMSPSAALACPYCLHEGFVRDFLSLSPPSRPARVVVRVSWAAA
jgi:hypothetical protein